MTSSEKVLIGGEAFKAMLSKVDPDRKITELKKQVSEATSVSKKDSLIKQIKYYAGLKKTGLKPVDAYIINHAPVVPPVTRPATVMGGNRIEFADINHLYRDHMLVNNSLKELIDVLPSDQLIKERADAYAGLKAVVGLGEAISPNSRGRDIKGILKQIGGTGGPKGGFFQSKLLSKKQDFSARATIYAEPNLGFNEVAVPEKMVWDTYKFHILRDLAKNGYDYVTAEKAWTDRTPAATGSFNKLIKEVPMILNRAPTLMKSNITAFYPIPIAGKSLGINPLMLPLFAGDYDGDSQSLYVPQTPEAVKEAKEKLLPRNQVHDYRRGIGHSMVAPGHEAILGSMYMTEPDVTQKTFTFKTEEEALEALKQGRIKENTPIKIS